MIKVLHVLGTTNLGGAESRIMDLYRHMDRDKVQFDFLVHMDEKEYEKAIQSGEEPEKRREPGHFDAEIENLGGHVYALPRFKVYNLSSYKKAANRFFAAHNDYSVIQGHMTSTASIYLPIAKKYGSMVTIAHTRNAGVDKGIKGFVTKYLRGSLPKKSDYLFACSHLAGDETFNGCSYSYIPNTIDTSRFIFNIADRKAIREKFNIPQNACVIGNVARFTAQKNQGYLIEAFAKLVGECAGDIYLIFCGDGPFKADCEALAAKLGIAEKVIFAGNQSEVEKFYSAMDIFAFPSKYEGLPGVVVEAQASGLSCIISDKITTEVILSDVTENLTIDSAADVWTKKLSEVINGSMDACDDEEKLSQIRMKYAAQVRKKGFDVNDQAKIMADFYMNPGDETLPNWE